MSGHSCRLVHPRHDQSRTTMLYERIWSIALVTRHIGVAIAGMAYNSQCSNNRNVVVSRLNVRSLIQVQVSKPWKGWHYPWITSASANALIRLKPLSIMSHAGRIPLLGDAEDHSVVFLPGYAAVVQYTSLWLALGNYHITRSRGLSRRWIIFRRLPTGLFVCLTLLPR